LSRPRSYRKGSGGQPSYDNEDFGPAATLNSTESVFEEANSQSNETASSTSLNDIKVRLDKARSFSVRKPSSKQVRFSKSGSNKHNLLPNPSSLRRDNPPKAENFGQDPLRTTGKGFAGSRISLSELPKSVTRISLLEGQPVARERHEFTSQLYPTETELFAISGRSGFKESLSVLSPEHSQRVCITEGASSASDEGNSFPNKAHPNVEPPRKVEIPNPPRARSFPNSVDCEGRKRPTRQTLKRARLSLQVDGQNPDSAAALVPPANTPTGKDTEHEFSSRTSKHQKPKHITPHKLNRALRASISEATQPRPDSPRIYENRDRVIATRSFTSEGERSDIGRLDSSIGSGKRLKLKLAKEVIKSNIHRIKTSKRNQTEKLLSKLKKPGD
jgi:hypothetical protein